MEGSTPCLIGVGSYKAPYMVTNLGGNSTNWQAQSGIEKFLHGKRKFGQVSTGLGCSSSLVDVSNAYLWGMNLLQLSGTLSSHVFSAMEDSESDDSFNGDDDIIDSHWSWSQLESTMGESYSAACISDDTTAMAIAVTSGTIKISSDSGETWISASGIPNTTWSTLACSKDVGIIVGAATDGSLYYSHNSGADWAEALINVTDSFHTIRSSR